MDESNGKVTPNLILNANGTFLILMKQTIEASI